MYAGGVALNSVANERIIRESGFKNVYIMAAAEDSGTAIGAAYHGSGSLRNTTHDVRYCTMPPDAVTLPSDVSARSSNAQNVTRC